MQNRKKILLISAFTNPYLDNNNRVLSVASVFRKNGWEVNLITASYSHTYKKFYSSFITEQKTLYETHFIDVPSYKSNLSVNRLISHFVFAIRTFFFLKHFIKNYLLVYSTVPSNFAPYLVNRLTKANNIPHVVDIIDIWPESFYVLAGKLQFVFKILSYPWKKLSHALYRNATMLIAASKKYAEFGRQFQSNAVNAYLLGVDTEKVQKLASESEVVLPEKKTDEVWIAYGGSLGYSYDFEVIIEALEELHKQNLNFRFIFIGGGVLEKHLKNIIQQKNINAFVTGRIAYQDYLKWLANCDIAVNSFKKGSLVGYSYKFNDYLASGCCVLNNLSGETAELVENHNLGLNFGHDKDELANILKDLISDSNRLSGFKNNVRKVSNDELSKDKILNKLYIDLTAAL